MQIEKLFLQFRLIHEDIANLSSGVELLPFAREQFAPVALETNDLQRFPQLNISLNNRVVTIDADWALMTLWRGESGAESMALVDEEVVAVTVEFPFALS